VNEHKFNPNQSFFPGFVTVGKHNTTSPLKFGGDSWSCNDFHPGVMGPFLFLVVDLSDKCFEGVLPRLPAIQVPLFSYVNLDGILECQEYLIDYECRNVSFLRVEPITESAECDCSMPFPMPESYLSIREMSDSEVPFDEDSYWKSIETFLGSNSFIRILGKPILINSIDYLDPDFSYFASIGYDSFSTPLPLVGNDPFYLGEVALYFFVSSDWKRIRVLSQAS
jgi:hypothetical protein